MARQFDCSHYSECLDAAALADSETFDCPCDRYQKNPNPASWRDVHACELLTLAVCWPEAFEVFEALRQAGDMRRKRRLLLESAARLNLPKRSML